jgi:hypothetical protein
MCVRESQGGKGMAAILSVMTESYHWTQDRHSTAYHNHAYYQDLVRRSCWGLCCALLCYATLCYAMLSRGFREGKASVGAIKLGLLGRLCMYNYSCVLKPFLVACPQVLSGRSLLLLPLRLEGPAVMPILLWEWQPVCV